MKILVISYHHNDKNSIGSVRTSFMQRLLPKYGIDVHVLTAGFHYKEITYEDNIISVRSNEFVSSKYALLKRKIKNLYGRISNSHYMISDWENIIIRRIDEIIIRSNPDIILCSYPPLWAIRLGLNIATITNLPLITDFRDSFLINPIENGLGDMSSEKYHYYDKINSMVKEQSRLILCASTDIYNSFDKNESLNKVKLIYNGFDSLEYKPKYDYFDRRLINILHTGRISLSERGTSIFGFSVGLLKSVRRMPALSKKIKFHFVGKLSLTEKLLLWPFRLIGIVELWGVVDRKDALCMQNNADVLFLITKPMSKNAISGKLIEYVKLNKAIFALTSGSEAEAILRRAKIGIIAPPNDPNLICDEICNIARLKYHNMAGDLDYINGFKDSVISKNLSEMLLSLKK